METGATEATPELGELLQEEPVGLAVPVRVDGAVLAQALPARRVQAATDLIPAATWTALLPATPKRARSVLLSTDKAFRVSPSGTGLGMLWPSGVPLTLRHSQAVYVMADDPAGATLSHYSELWAD